MKSTDMTNERSVQEFRDTGLLMFINQFLHIFGWAIGVNIDDDNNQTLVPMRVKFRGFSPECINRNYEKLASYIRDNGNVLYEEADYKSNS